MQMSGYTRTECDMLIEQEACRHSSLFEALAYKTLPYLVDTKPLETNESSEATVGLMDGLAEDEYYPDSMQDFVSEFGMDSVLNSPVNSMISTDATSSSSLSLLSRIKSPARKSAIKSVFYQFTLTDTMSVEDLGMALRFVGHNLTPSGLEYIIEETDEDGGGTVDFDEFSAAVRRLDATSSGDASAAEEGSCASHAAQARAKELRRIFGTRAEECIFSANGQSDIVMQSKDLLGALCLAGHRVSDAAAQALLSEFDEDGSGLLDFEEFQQMVGKLDSDTYPAIGA